LPSSCREWTQPDGLHFRGMCSNEFWPKPGAEGCNICVTPPRTDPLLNCFECPGEWPGAYRIRGNFAMSGPEMSGELMYMGENATYVRERNAYSFPWTWAQINEFLTDAVVVAAGGNCYWCKAMTSLCFCRAAQDFVSTIASCGSVLNHKAQRTSWVLDNQLYNWPQWLTPIESSTLGQYCYSSVNGADYSRNASSPFGAKYTPDVSGRWPSGYGVLSGSIIAPSPSVTIGNGGVITDQPLFVSCPDAQQVTFDVFRNKWKGLYFVKAVTMTLQTFVPPFGPSQMSLSIAIDHGGVPTWENVQRKSDGIWRVPDFATGVTVANPADDLIANRPKSGRTYTSVPDCSNKARIKLTGPSGANPEGWPESIYITAET
jgi:hypothetical protein